MKIRDEKGNTAKAVVYYSVNERTFNCGNYEYEVFSEQEDLDEFVRLFNDPEEGFYLPPYGGWNECRCDFMRIEYASSKSYEFPIA